MKPLPWAAPALGWGAAPGARPVAPLLLDREATAALDENLEAEIYAVIAEKLPDTTVISIGHRSTLLAFHSRRINMQKRGESFAPVDAAD